MRRAARLGPPRGSPLFGLVRLLDFGLYGALDVLHTAEKEARTLELEGPVFRDGELAATPRLILGPKRARVIDLAAERERRRVAGR